MTRLKLNWTPLFLASFVILALTSCAMNTPQKNVDVHPVEIVQQKPLSILEFANDITNEPVDQQKKELNDLTQSLSRNTQAIDIRMKIALLLGLPESRVRDPIKAQGLLEDLLKEKSIDNEYRMLATIVRDYISDTNRYLQKSRDEQKRADGYSSKLETLQVKVNEAQQRANALQQKLDDLKEIEKNMVDRGIHK